MSYLLEQEEPDISYARAKKVAHIFILHPLYYFALLGIMLPITVTVHTLLVFSFKFGQTLVLPEISKQTLCELGLVVLIFNHTSIYTFALISISFR